MNMIPESFYAILLAIVWGGFGLYGLWRLARKSTGPRDAFSRFRKAGLSTRATILAGLVAAIAAGGTKPGDPGSNAPSRGRQMKSAPVSAVPATAPVEVVTEDVLLRPESPSAEEWFDWRLHGSSGGGIWIDSDEPFFRVGTNPVARVHVSADGCLSFDSTHRPPVGEPLPDGSGLSVLVPFLASLGMVPEANWTDSGAISRFWTDAAPGRGRVFTWENALLDRLPGRRATIQAELNPSGDWTVRYHFKDALVPPATNFVIGAQFAGTGVNALSVLGTEIQSETVWRVNGAVRTNGVSISDLLCSNGVLQTPARFAIEWKNTTGLLPESDTDGDGLTDREEIFRYGTDPAEADTDGDGFSDGAERQAGTDPLDADENGDGVPDGVSASAWASNPLHAAGSSSADCRIVLASDLPPGTAASLVLGDWTIPLSAAGSWDVDLPAGEIVDVRLFSTSPTPIPLSILPSADRGGQPAPPRSGTTSPRYRDDPDGLFEGRSCGGNARLAEPTMRIVLADGTEAPPDLCLHGGSRQGEFRLRILPAEAGLTANDADLEGFARDQDHLLLLDLNGMPRPASARGAATVSGPLDFGALYDEVRIHDCEEGDSRWCPRCLMCHSETEGCSHDPECPFRSNPDSECSCPPRVIRVSDSETIHSVPIRLVGTTHCCCPSAGSAVGAVLESVSTNLIVRDSNGMLFPGNRCEGALSVSAIGPSGAVPSEIRYRLVGQTGTGALTNLETRTAKFWAVRIRHRPVTIDQGDHGYVNPCGILLGSTAEFRFSIDPASFPDSAVAWSVDRPDRAAFTSGTNGVSVTLRGLAEGPVKLTADIRGYAGPSPVLYAGVLATNVVRAKAFLLDEDSGPVRSEESIVDLFPVANRIFSQVGIRFVLDPTIGHIADTNYLDIRKEHGTYPLGLDLVDHAHGTGGVELYFVRAIEGAVGLSTPGGIILDRNANGHELAHELGHACGLEDVLDRVVWKPTPNGEDRWTWDWSPPARDRIPYDWGTDDDEGYCDIIYHKDLIPNLLMCGRTTDHNEDISFGDAKGLIPVSDTAPPTNDTCAIGFFTVPGHLPVHP